MHRKNVLFLVLSCAALLGLQQANAAPLPVGGVILAAAEAKPVGGAVIDSLVSPFSVPGKFSGTLITDVIAGDTSNPWGGLTFVYTLSNDAGSSNPLTALTINGFTGSLTDAAYNGAGVAPTLIDRLTDDTVGFRFLPPSPLGGNGVLVGGPGGSTSALLIVQTNRGAYTSNIAQVIDGAVTNAAVLVPVPEPSTLVLAAAGLALACAFVRRKR